MGLDLVTLFFSQEILKTHFAGGKHFPFLSLQTGFPSTSPHCPGHCGGLWEGGQSPGWKGHGQGTRVTGEGLGVPLDRLLFFEQVPCQREACVSCCKRGQPRELVKERRQSVFSRWSRTNSAQSPAAFSPQLAQRIRPHAASPVPRAPRAAPHPPSWLSRSAQLMGEAASPAVIPSSRAGVRVLHRAWPASCRGEERPNQGPGGTAGPLPTPSPRPPWFPAAGLPSLLQTYFLSGTEPTPCLCPN